MAAHAYRALLQAYAMLEQNEDWRGQLDAALRLSCWTEDIGFDAWKELRNAVDIEDDLTSRDVCMDVVMNLIPRISSEWVSLNKPDTREQWYVEMHTARLTKVNGIPAVTGVISGNSVSEAFFDLQVYHGIDPEEPTEDDEDAEEYDYEPSRILVGAWKQDEADGKWGANPYHQEYTFAAICNLDRNTIQVVWSENAMWCNKCSPCYPGQGDLDTPVGSNVPDSFWAFDLPIEYKREVEC